MTRIETAVILATDLLDCAELAHRLGSGPFGVLRREHDSILGDEIEEAGGRIIKTTGGGLLACAPSVTAALTAAVAIQQHLDRHGRAAPIALRVRIGISVGDVAVEDGDCFGLPPIEATRLCERAGAGEILVADPVRVLAREPDHRLVGRGELELAGLAHPVRVWSVQWDPLPEIGPASLPARLGGLLGSAYVGRTTEQDVLADSWERALGGARQVVVISGEPGIGKTRLVTQAAGAIAPDRAVILYGRCDEDQGMPYHPWLEILRDYVRVAPRRLLRPHAAALARLVPELGARLDLPPAPPSADPDGDRFRLFSAVGALLTGAAELNPVLVVIDDLHWADQPTLRLFKHLVTAPPTGQLMLVGTFRDSDITAEAPLSALLADLRREPGVHRIALAGLEETEVVDLIQMTAGHPIDAPGLALAGAVHRETAGNPFFVGEMLRHLRETGAIAVDGAGHWGFAASPTAAGLPQSVREVIGRRLHRLGGPARRLLAAASVLGTEFELGPLGAVAGLAPTAVLDLLDEAIAASLLTPISGSAPGPADRRFAFSHGLVQTTLYDAVPSGRRVTLHRAAGAAIEAQGGDPVERLAELAHHYLEAAPSGDTARAVDYATRAGRRAMSQFAYDEAAVLFARALRIAPAPGPRIALLQALGEAQMRSGDAEAARGTLLEAAGAARQGDDPEALARAVLACGIWGLSFGVDEVLVGLAEEAVARLEGGPNVGLEAEAKGFLAAALYYAPGPAGECRHRLSDEAVALARGEYERTGERTAAATLAYVLGRALLAAWGPESAEGDVECAELLELCHRLDHGELEMLTRNWRTTVLLELGDFAAVEEEVARIEHMATTSRQPRAIAFLPLHRGMRAIVSGHLAEAERLNLASTKIGARLRGAGSELAATAQLLVIRLLQGRLPELEVPLRALTQAHPGMVALRAALVVLLLQAAEEAEARAEFHAMMTAGVTGVPRDNTQIVTLALLAEAAADLGEEAGARELHQALLPRRGRWVVSPTAAGLWPVDRSLGVLAGAFGDFDLALAHLAAGRALGRVAGALPTTALIALDEARLRARRRAPGDAGQAALRAREARLLAADIGMLGVAAEARRLEVSAVGAAIP